MDLLCAKPVENRLTTSEPAVRTAFSKQHEPEAAARELALSLRHAELGFVLFFCSAECPLDTLGDAMSEAFLGVTLPAILITASHDAALKARARREGLDCLLKPLKPLRLRMVLLQRLALASP